MAKSRWELRLSDTKGKNCRLRLAISYKSQDKYKTLRYGTDYLINKDHWDKKKQIIKNGLNFSDEHNHKARVSNKELEALKNKIDTAFIKINTKYEAVKPDDIRKYLNSEKKESSKDLRFSTIWESYLNSKKANCSKGTIEKLNSVYLHVLAFDLNVSVEKLPENSSSKLFINEIDISWFTDFREYCIDPKKANLFNQTTSKYIEQIKTFLNWCVVQDLIPREQKEKIIEGSRVLSLDVIENKKVVVTKSDLQKLRSLKIDTPYINNVRSLFILSCLTGLRFSDYSAIKPQHLKQDLEGNYYIEKIVNKTQKAIRIPLNQEGKMLVDNLLEGVVKPISNQKVNDYLKILFASDGLDFDDEVEMHHKQGSVLHTTVSKKYKLVSSHTGRRSFATFMLMEGVPDKTVMKYTGHKDYKSFAKYVNIPEVDEENMIRNVLTNF